MAKYTKRRDKRGYEWKSAYREKEALMLERGYLEVSPHDFYRELFPAGSLQQEPEDGKGNIIATQIRPSGRGRTRQWVIDDSLKMLDKVIGDRFGLIPPISFYGKSHTKENAHELFAVVVDVDCVAPGSAYNYLGSSSWVALTVEKPIVDEQRRTMNWAHVVPGMLHPSGTMQAAGSSYNWMINQLCQHEQALAAQSGRSVFELIDEQILSSPIGANKLLFLPYMLGERTPRWNVDAKGAFIGLTLGHQHGDMLRAVMEGITLNLGFIVNIFRQHVPIDQVTVIGGCAQNPVWRQMMADIYQAEIRVPNYLEEATSMGAAILAGIGAGVFKDFSVIDRFVRIEQTVLQLKSLEAFAAAANGRATKIIIPSEIQGIAGLVKSIAEVAGDGAAEK